MQLKGKNGSKSSTTDIKLQKPIVSPCPPASNRARRYQNMLLGEYKRIDLTGGSQSPPGKCPTNYTCTKINFELTEALKDLTNQRRIEKECWERQSSNKNEEFGWRDNEEWRMWDRFRRKWEGSIFCSFLLPAPLCTHASFSHGNMSRLGIHYSALCHYHTLILHNLLWLTSCTTYSLERPSSCFIYG